MALYEIRHSCGHTVETQIYGTNVHGEREREAERMAARPCPECRWAAEEARRRAANAEAARANAEAGMAALDGSPKQVAWAEGIRAGMHRELSELIDGMRRRPECGPENEAMMDACLASFRAEASAEWFIDNRLMTAVECARHFSKR